MKKMFVLLLAVLLISCSNSGDSTATSSKTKAAAATVTLTPMHATYTPSQVNDLIKNKKKLLIIDVRSAQELKEGKLKNSVLIPFWNIMRGNYTLPHDRPILLYCAVGGRSYGAMQILSRKGFVELYNMKGGINAWKKEGRPVIY